MGQELKSSNHLLIIDNNEKLVAYYLACLKNKYPQYTYTLVNNPTSGLNRIYYNNFNILLINYDIAGENLTGKMMIKEAMIMGKPVISYSPKLFSFIDYYINALTFPVNNGTHLLIDYKFDNMLADAICTYISNDKIHNPIDISKNLLSHIK